MLLEIHTGLRTVFCHTDCPPVTKMLVVLYEHQRGFLPRSSFGCPCFQAAVSVWYKFYYVRPCIAFKSICHNKVQSRFCYMPTESTGSFSSEQLVKDLLVFVFIILFVKKSNRV